MRALISDIHGNLEALEAIRKDMQALRVESVICLGDVIGYGPNPGECVDLAREFGVVLAGNHEEAVLRGPLGFNTLARESALWTRKQLRPTFGSFKGKRARWEFLKILPLRHIDDGNLFVHASPRDPTQEYILQSDTEVLFGGKPEKLVDIFRRFEQVCFIGHTHCPGIITQDFCFHPLREIASSWTMKENEKIIVNIGSAGQPRDGDNRACYVVQDGKRLQFRRIPYDFENTIEKIKRIPQLNDRNGERLRYGA